MAGNANSGSKREKLVRDALMLAVSRVQEGDPQGRRKLALAAQAIVEKAVDGDLGAFKEIADRLDGKPVQQTEISGPDGEAIPIGMKVTFVDGSGNSGT
jgi:hypothetical protein